MNYGYSYTHTPKARLIGGAFSPLSLSNTQFWSDPTVQTSINSNLSQSLDGSTDALNADALLSDLSSTTGIFAGWVKMPDITPSINSYIVSFGDTIGSSDRIGVWVNTLGRLNVNCIIGGVTQFHLSTDSIIGSNSTWVHCAIIKDGVTPKLYINGVFVSQTFSNSTDKTKWINDNTLVDNMRIGCYNINSSGNALFLGGDLDEWGFWNNDTAVTASSLYNSGAGKTLTDLTTSEKVGLKGYYTLNDYLDTSGNGNTLTAIGTPTDAIGKVQTIVIAGEPIYTLGDLSTASNNGSQTTLINEPTWNTTHVTYATNDFVNIDDVLADISSSTQGTISFWYKPLDATPVGNEIIISFGDDDGDEYLGVFSKTDGKVQLSVRDAEASTTLITDAVALTSGVWTHIYIEHNGTDSTVYIDNVAVSQTNTGIAQAKWFSALTGLSNGRLGCLNYVSAGNILFSNGDIQQVYISTDVKTTAERTNLYNYNQP